MTEIQGIVNSINSGWKTDHGVEYSFRDPLSLEECRMVFSWEEIEDGLVRLWKRRKFIVIDRKIVDVPVGSVQEGESNGWRGGIGS